MYENIEKQKKKFITKILLPAVTGQSVLLLSGIRRGYLTKDIEESLSSAADKGVGTLNIALWVCKNAQPGSPVSLYGINLLNNAFQTICGQGDTSYPGPFLAQEVTKEYLKDVPGIAGQLEKIFRVYDISPPDESSSDVGPEFFEACGPLYLEPVNRITPIFSQSGEINMDANLEKIQPFVLALAACAQAPIDSPEFERGANFLLEGLGRKCWEESKNLEHFIDIILEAVKGNPDAFEFFKIEIREIKAEIAIDKAAMTGNLCAGIDLNEDVQQQASAFIKQHVLPVRRRMPGLIDMAAAGAFEEDTHRNLCALMHNEDRLVMGLIICKHAPYGTGMSKFGLNLLREQFQTLSQRRNMPDLNPPLAREIVKDYLKDRPEVKGELWAVFGMCDNVLGLLPPVVRAVPYSEISGDEEEEDEFTSALNICFDLADEEIIEGTWEQKVFDEAQTMLLEELEMLYVQNSPDAKAFAARVLDCFMDKEALHEFFVQQIKGFEALRDAVHVHKKEWAGLGLSFDD